MRTASALCLLSLVLPATAGASTSNGGGADGIGFTGAPGEVNIVSIARTPDALRYRLTESGAADHAPVAGSKCVQGSTAKIVECAGTDVPYVVAQLGDGSDTFNAGAIYGAPLIGDGGTGDDTITGGSGDDLLGGAVGNDTLSGDFGDDVFDDRVSVSFGFGAIVDAGAGNDTSIGGSGDDLWRAGTASTGLVSDQTGAGQDTFNGGQGHDTADYSARTAPLTITVAAGTKDDGEGGEGDTVAEADRILAGSGADVVKGSQVVGGTNLGATLVGGAGDDVLTGTPVADRLHGGHELSAGAPDGDDVLDGGLGADVLSGGTGTDTATYATRSAPVTVTVGAGATDGTAGEGDDVREDVEIVIGGNGPDALTGSDGAETLRSEGGGDVLTGGDGADRLLGGAGEDRIEARDGTADQVACGADADVVVADAVDVVDADCETVDRPATTPPGDGPATPSGSGPGGPGQAGSGTGSTSTGGSGSNGPIVIEVPGQTGPVATIPVAPVVIDAGKAKLTARGRLAVKLTCPGPGDCAGLISLTPAKPAKAGSAAKPLVALPYGLPAGRTHTFSLTLSAKARKAARKAPRKNGLFLTVGRTGTAPSTRSISR